VPSVRRFRYKLKLNKRQLAALHCLLERESIRFEELIFTSPHSWDSLEGYRIFCSTLVEIVATVAPVKVPGPGRGGLGRMPTPAPWWNNRCSDAVASRRALCRMYKSNPTLDNWIAFRGEVARCRRVLRREKRIGWRQLCTSFTSKTLIAAIWKFVRSYKKKSLTRGLPTTDDRTEVESQDLIIDKLSFLS